MIKAIIFDFDGVILESVNIKTEAFVEIFSECSEDVVDAVKKHHIDNGGISRVEKFKYIYANILNKPLSEDELKDLCQQFESLVVEKVLKAPFVAGAEELLDKCFQEYQMFVVSGTPQKEIQSIVEKRHLKQYFIETLGTPTSKVENTKDILSRFSFTPEECIFIGDSVNDLEAAKECGIYFIGRMSEQTKDSLKVSDVDQGFSDMQDVYEHIASLNETKAV